SFSLSDTAPTITYTLSLHDALPISLATVDFGTALGVIFAAHEQGKNIHVWVDETRPRLQGARLTAWELMHAEIPMHLIADNAARSEEHTSELQSRENLVCRLLLEKK